MKKILLTICSVLFAMLAQCQEHMTFKGIPMDCNLTSFVSKLESKGYIKEVIQDNGAVLSGNFAGKDDCTILVVCTASSKLVWKIAVQFPERVSWNSLKNEYNSLKESYIEKYGTPISFEFFSNPYYEGDGFELQALILEKCTYSSFFYTSQGNILLKIGTKGRVEVHYEDNINLTTKRKEQENVIASNI